MHMPANGEVEAAAGNGESAACAAPDAPRFVTDMVFENVDAPAADVAFELQLTSTIVDARGHRLVEVKYGVSDTNGKARIVSQTVI